MGFVKSVLSLVSQAWVQIPWPAVAFLCRVCTFSLPAWLPSRHSGFLPQSNGVHVRLIGDSKVNVSANGHLSLCVSPATDW